MRLRTLFPSILAYSLSCPALEIAEVLPSLPEDDPAIPFLERMDGTPGCRLPDRRPWPGETVLACLDAFLVQPGDRTDSVFAARLRRRLDLRGTADAGWGMRPAWSQEREGRTDRLFLDLGAEGHLVSNSDSDRVSGILGGRLRPRVEVLLGDRLALWSRPFQLTEVSDRARWTKSMDPGKGEYQTALFAQPGEAAPARTVDGLEGGIEARLVGVRVRSGLLRTTWGNLPEPLMFSGRTGAMPLTEVAAEVGPIEASVLGARLVGETFDERRYLYGHRLRWRGSTWSVAWSEAAISVGRGLEPLYLVPVFPMILSEHMLGDPDNRQMDFDGSWRPIPALELSAELFLDDLQNFLGFLSDGWGNKWALGVGLEARNFTGRRTLDRLQAARIEPWTGGPSSAVLPGEESNAPVHFGSPLGSALGPNSLALSWERRQDLSERWSWLSSLRAQWKGAGPGSSVSDRNWRDSSGAWVVAHSEKRWLGRLAWTRQIATTGAELRLGGQWRGTLEAGVEVSDIPGERHVWPVFAARVAFRE